MKSPILLPFLITIVYSEDKSLNPIGCGKRLSDFPNKIVGGYKATVGDWGWQVGLNFFNIHSCGGSLINTEWILTATHCLYGLAQYPQFFSINIGYNNILIANSWSINSKISKIILHENYSPTTFSNDIALIKLSSPVTYSKYIVPACLPTVNDVDYSGKLSWSTGWGTTSNGGSLSEDLLEVVLPILSDDSCNLKYQLIDIKKGFCAGVQGDNKDTCQGDSGGPLIVQDNNGSDRGIWTLAGITSYGYGCGDGGVVTRVSNYFDWIKDKVENNRNAKFF